MSAFTPPATPHRHTPSSPSNFTLSPTHTVRNSHARDSVKPVSPYITRAPSTPHQTTSLPTPDPTPPSHPSLTLSPIALTTPNTSLDPSGLLCSPLPRGPSVYDRALDHHIAAARAELVERGDYLGQKEVRDTVIWGPEDDGCRTLKMRFGEVAGDDDASLACIATVKPGLFRLIAQGNYERLEQMGYRHPLRWARASGWLTTPEGGFLEDDWMVCLDNMRYLEGLVADKGREGLHVVCGSSIRITHRLFKVESPLSLSSFDADKYAERV